MFRSFFGSREWFLWSILGTALIITATWYKVQLDVQINEWFGDFYNIIQEALSGPNTVTFSDYFAKCLTFLKIASVYIVVAITIDFFARHYVFRWRTAMNDYYMKNWTKLRHIEGAAQRVQEDTMRFAQILESLGVAFIRSVLLLLAFLPILWELSKHVTELPVIGPVDHALVYVALLSAIFGTGLLAVVGIKLPGLEFKNQRVEAAYRKELVYGEDDDSRASPPKVLELFTNIRRNYFRMYLHYLYFDLAKYSYLQSTVIIPYIVLGPTLISATITLGIFQQIIRAFGKVEEAFQFLVLSWGTIISLISIYKRLSAFERAMRDEEISEYYIVD